MSRPTSLRLSVRRGPSLPTCSAASACPSASARCARSRSGTGFMSAARAISTRCPACRRSCARIWRSISRWSAPKWWPNRFPPTARANGCFVSLPKIRASGRIEVECVYIPETDRGTLCVSSQVGCTLTCSFCHTGTQRLVRNLTAGEIVGQMHGGARPARRFPGRRADEGRGLPTEGDRWCPTSWSWAWASRSTISRRCATRFWSPSDGEGLSHLQAPHHAVDLGRGAEYRARRRRDRLRCSRSRCMRCATSCAMSSCRSTANIRSGIARRLPRLSRRLQCAPHHLRICDAEGRQRFARRGEGTGAAAQGHPGQDQPDPVQSLAGHAHTNARTGSRSRNSRKWCSTPAMPRRCAPRAGATSSPPAASSRARPRSSPSASAWLCARWR